LCDTFQCSGEEDGMNVEESGDLYTNDTIKKTDDRDMVRVRVPKLIG
jgi:hypothetical protein